MDFKPARHHVNRTVRCHAPGQDGSWNAIAKDYRLAKTSARIKCHQMSFALGPPAARNSAAVEFDVLQKRSDDSVEYALKIAHIPKRNVAVLAALLQENSFAVGRELICAKRMGVPNQLPRLFMDSPESFPADACGDKRVNTTNFKQIEKAQGNRVINLIELRVPNSRRAVSSVFDFEFVAPHPAPNPPRSDAGQPRRFWHCVNPGL